MISAPAKKRPAAVRLGAVIGGLIVLAVAGNFILVQPLKNKASSLTKEIATKSQEINESQSQSQQAAGLSKILVADYLRLTTAMPDEPQVPELYLQLDAIARDTGVSFDGITPANPVNASGYQVIPLALTFQGDFIHLSDFLHRLQSLVLVENHRLVARGRLITIDQVAFAEGEKGFPRIAASVQINAYVFGQPFTITGPAAGGASSSTTGGTDTSTTSTTTSTG